MSSGEWWWEIWSCGKYNSSSRCMHTREFTFAVNLSQSKKFSVRRSKSHFNIFPSIMRKKEHIMSYSSVDMLAQRNVSSTPTASNAIIHCVSPHSYLYPHTKQTAQLFLWLILIESHQALQTHSLDYNVNWVENVVFFRRDCSQLPIWARDPIINTNSKVSWNSFKHGQALMDSHSEKLLSISVR